MLDANKTPFFYLKLKIIILEFKIYCNLFFTFVIKYYTVLL